MILSAATDYTMSSGENNAKDDRKKLRKRQTSKFLTTLYGILEDGRNKECIRWTESGMQFTVLDTYALSESVLPAFFKHNNYATFIRQLNMYGFQKGKEKGLDVFAHPMFIKGKMNLLGCIERNQRRKGGSECEFAGVGRSEEGSCEISAGLGGILLEEIRQLQRSQAGLESLIKLSTYQNQAHDLKFQMTVNHCYHKERSEKIGAFIIFVLSKYLANGGVREGEAMTFEQVSFLNGIVQSWIGRVKPCARTRDGGLRKCFIVFRFFSTFNMNCQKLSKEKQDILEEISMEFLNWVRDFIKRNRIHFPHVDTLFEKLIYCVVALPEMPLESLSGKDLLWKMKDKLEEILPVSSSGGTPISCQIDCEQGKDDQDMDLISQLIFT